LASSISTNSVVTTRQPDPRRAAPQQRGADPRETAAPRRTRCLQTPFS
jgi:hypothetical protein